MCIMFPSYAAPKRRLYIWYASVDAEYSQLHFYGCRLHVVAVYLCPITIHLRSILIYLKQTGSLWVLRRQITAMWMNL